MQATRFWRSLGVVAALAVAVVACAPSAPPSPAAAPAKEAAPSAAKPAAKAPVTLRGVSSWERSISFTQPFLQLIDRINKKTNGELQIQFAGPEVVPPFEGVTAVSKGAFDLTHTSPAYYATNLPESNALHFAIGSCQKYRQAGALDLFDQAHRQKTRTTFLGCSGGGSGFVLLAKDQVQSLDYYKGKKMRSHPLYGPILVELGASTVEVPPAEVYTAVERRVVDGIAWPENGIIERKLHEVLKYMVKPAWLEVRLDYVMNLDSFNKLSPQLQQALLETVRELEDEVDAMLRKETEKEQAELQKQGMQILNLPPAEAQKLLKVVDDVTWGKIIKDSPEWGPKLREAFSKVAR